MTTGRSGWRKALLSVHVLASVGAFGADLTLLVLGVASVLGVDPRSVYPPQTWSGDCSCNRWRLSRC